MENGQKVNHEILDAISTLEKDILKKEAQIK